MIDVMTTDDLLEQLPDHLQLARNSNAPEHDRWRIWNRATGQVIAPGFATARDLLIATLKRLREIEQTG